MASGRMREDNGDASAYCGAEVLTDRQWHVSLYGVATAQCGRRVRAKVGYGSQPNSGSAASLDASLARISKALLEVLESALRLNEGIRVTRDWRSKITEGPWRSPTSCCGLTGKLEVKVGRQARQLTSNRICSTTMPNQADGQCGRKAQACSDR
jgi:hypothetical protein